jgi:hypothetical protein
MSLEIDKLHFTVSLDFKGLKKQTEEVRKLMEGMSGSTVIEGQKMDNTFKKLAKAAAAFFSIQAVAGFIRKLISVRGEFESLGISFESMLKSKEKADQLMYQVIQLAKTTPFSLTEVASGAKSLLAYGFSAKEVTSELKRLGDISAGLSIPIGDLVYLYGTTRTQGRAMTKDLMQFAGRGIPIYEELAKIFKVSTQEVSKLVEAGKVGFPQVQQAIHNLTNEGGMFENLMIKQSKSLTGMISNLGDVWNQFLNVLGSGALGNIIKKIVSGLTSMFGGIVENSKSSVDKFKDQLSLQTASKGTLTKLLAEYDALKGKLSLTADEQTRLNEVVGQLGGKVGTAVTAWGDLGQATDIARQKIINFMEQDQKLTEYLNQTAIKEVERQIKTADLNAKIRLDEMKAGKKTIFSPTGAIVGTEDFNNEDFAKRKTELEAYQTEANNLRIVLKGLKGDYSDFIVETTGPGKEKPLLFDPESIKAAEQIYKDYQTLVTSGRKKEADEFYKMQIAQGSTYADFLNNQLELYKNNSEAKKIILLELAEIERKIGEEEFEAKKRRNEIINKGFKGSVQPEKYQTKDESGKITTTTYKPDVITAKGLSDMNKALPVIHNVYTQSEKIRLIWEYIKEDISSPDAWNEVANAFDEISGSLEGVNSDAAEFMAKMSKAAKNISSLIANSVGGNWIGAAASGLSLILGLMENKEQDRLDIAQNLANELEREADALERQLALLDAINGTNKLGALKTGIEAINKDIKDTAEKLAAVVEYEDPEGGGHRGSRNSFSSLSGTDWSKVNFETISQEDLNKLIEYQNLKITSAEAMRGNTDDLKSELDYLLEIDRLTKLKNDRGDNLNAAATGTTAQAITDEIAAGFENGLNSVQDFADTTEGIIKKALLASFKTKFLTSQLEGWYKQFADASASGGELSESESNDLLIGINTIIGNASKGWETMQKFATDAGLGTLGGSNAQNSLAGAIKGVTEDTAGLLAGQIGAIRINCIEQKEIATQQLFHLANIDNNTFNTVGELKLTVGELKSMNAKLGNGSFDTLRANGI